MAREFIDMETGEIIDLERFRKTQLRLVRQTQPVWKRRKSAAQRKAWGKWAFKLMNHLGPMVLLAILAWSVLASTPNYGTPTISGGFPWNPSAHATSKTLKPAYTRQCGTAATGTGSQPW
jgi:hypothetical protein